MRLVDTDVMVDVLRAHGPALAWLRSLGDEEIGLPGLVAMELIRGCSDRREVQHVQRLIEPFRVYWPTWVDCDRALATFARGHLTHRLGVIDTLIGELAVGLGVPLCTFNARHYVAVPSLRTEQPYTRR